MASAPTIFVSYAPEDSAFVVSLMADLAARGLSGWEDRQGLRPGAADWEEARRRAIRGCQAVVLVVSPDARRSRFVKAELAVAEMYGRAVVPVWAAGEQWLDCMPLALCRVHPADDYDAQADTATCPAGTPLPFWRASRTVRRSLYHATAATCNTCPLKERCRQPQRSRDQPPLGRRLPRSRAGRTQQAGLSEGRPQAQRVGGTALCRSQGRARLAPLPSPAAVAGQHRKPSSSPLARTSSACSVGAAGGSSHGPVVLQGCGWLLPGSPSGPCARFWLLWTLLALSPYHPRHLVA